MERMAETLPVRVLSGYLGGWLGYASAFTAALPAVYRSAAQWLLAAGYTNAQANADAGATFCSGCEGSCGQAALMLATLAMS
jgi:hypothetical protein